VESFYDRLIGPREERRSVIDEHLNSSQIILLLVSRSFLGSEYCVDVEMKRAMERHKSGAARVVPIICRDCDWHSADFADLQALPRTGRAITEHPNRDTAYADIARELRKIVLDLVRNKRSATVDRAVAPAAVTLEPRLQAAETVRDREPVNDRHDPNTFNRFSEAQLRTLAEVRHDLGSEAVRTDVRKWFQVHRGTEYAPAWIVCNRFIVKKSERGRGAVCILDPDCMPDMPFPRVVNRATRR